MSERAQALATRFERASEELVAAVAGCGGDAWRAPCADTGWSVGVQADHIVAAEAFTTDYVGRLARGEVVEPVPMAAINQGNDQRAAQAASADQAAVVGQLRREMAAAAGLIRGLSDEQLGRTGQIVAEVPAQSVAEWIEYLSIGEIERHGGCLRQALGNGA